MQAITKKLGFTFTILFFIGVAYSAYSLYELPSQMMHAATVVDLNVIGQLQPTLFRLYIICGATALVGLAAITFNSINSRSHQSTALATSKKSEAKSEAQSAEEIQHAEGKIQIDSNAIEEVMSEEEDKSVVFNKVLSLICNEVEASQAAAYITREEEDAHFIDIFASYAYHVPEGEKKSFRYGEGLAGQVAKEGKLVNIDAIPEGYIKILSGLGSASPRHLLIIPLKEADKVVGVVEIASFHAFNRHHESALQHAFDKLALKLVNDDNVSLEKAKR